MRENETNQNLLAQETWINKTEGYCNGDSDVYETRFNTVSEAFKGFRDLYGRCIGKVHIDRNGETKDVGWVFEKREKYTDTKETYLLETWVTLHEAKPERTIKYKYVEI